MRFTKLIWSALFATIIAAFALVGCEELEILKIDAPADLQHKIDSIAQTRKGSGDTTNITILTPIVGAEDNSTGWNGAHSDYFRIPSNKLLHLEFLNYGTGQANWNNWNLAVTTLQDDPANYSPDGGQVGYFTLRSDAYGWGNADYNGTRIAIDYPDANENGDIWDDFLATMQGAYVTLEVDHSATGSIYVTATAVGTNGVTLTQTYDHPVSGMADIVAFLVTDGSHFLMKKAYLLPSRVTAVADSEPVSIAINGAPSSVEIGDENFWGNAIATVTFADGSTAPIDSADLSFNVIPDMQTVGTKTVVISYSKTKLGKFTRPVSTVYNLEVTASVTSLSVTTLPRTTTYYFYDNAPINFIPDGMVVTATYSNGSTGEMPLSNLEFGKITAAAGAQTALITYVGNSSTVTTTCPVNLVQGLSQVGNTDFSTPWPTASSPYTVASGSSRTVTLYLYSNNLQNFNSPSVVLGKAGKLNTDVQQADGASVVVRMDHFGWGPGYVAANATSNWNWDTFKPNLSGSRVEIEITNNGDNTATIRYDVTYANGETHFQQYANQVIDSSDLSFALVTEGAYLVIID